MAFLNALRGTPGALQRNPVLFVPVLVLMLFQVPQLVLQSIDPLLASVVSLGLSLVFVFVMPFFQAGIIGMADEALDERTSLESFLREGKANYVSVLVAYLVLVAANFAIGFAAFIMAIPIGFAVFSDLRGGVGIVVLAIAGMIALIIGLAYLLFIFFIQFYGQAIVIDDFGAVDGLKHSYAVVRRNLVSTLGHSVLVGVLGGLAGGVFAIASMLVSPQSTTVLSLPNSRWSPPWVSHSSSASSARCSVGSSASTPSRSIGRSMQESPMVLDRKTAVAGLAMTVVVLSQWPVIDSSSLQLAIFCCGGILVVALGLSERARASRLVMGMFGVLFVVQGGYEVLSRTSRIGLVIGSLYGGLGATVILYRFGVAPWGTPGESTGNS